MVVAPYSFNPAKFSFHYSHESLCLIFEVVGIIVPMLYAGIHMESFVLEQLSAKWSSIGGQQKWLIIQGSSGWSNFCKLLLLECTSGPQRRRNQALLLEDE